MDGIVTFIRLILYCVPFVGICLVSTKLNFKKEHRYKQVFLPVIALIYCIVGVIFLNGISDKVLNGIYWLINRFRFLSFLGNINWAHAAVFVVNSALVAGFMVVKGTLFPALMGLAVIPKLADYTSGMFYYVTKDDRKNGNTDVRYLMSKYGDAKKILQAMYYTVLGVFAFLLVITYYMTSNKVFSAPFYPAFGIIVLGEAVAFLSGKTYEEKQAEEEEQKPEGWEPEEETDYDLLPEKYDELFPNRLIQHSALKADGNENESAKALLEKYKREYEETLNQEAGLLYTYYSGSAFHDKVLDEGYLRQARNILDGKSVIFFTQFYKDTTDYVFLPIIRNMMKSKRILVILGHGSNTENIREWFYNGISSISGFERIWKVDAITESDDDTSVMVLDAKNIYNQKLLNEKAALLSETSMVFIIEANRLLGTLQIGLSCLVSYLRDGGNDPQYIIFDRNCDGLVDSLSHVLNKSIVQVNATSVGTAKRNLLVWKADGELLHHRLGLASSRYLGVGTELALAALKEKVSKAVWTSSRKFPVIDMRWIASQYYSSLCKAAGLKVSQNELAEHLEYIEDPWSIPKSDDSFIVAEDEYNNAFEVARQFSTRGAKQSFVNVISQQYWLREYMTDNPEIFQQDPKSIPTITADYQRSASNIVYKLIIRMIEGPIEEEEVCDSLDILGEDTEHVYRSLRSLILKYFFRIEEGEDTGGQFSVNIDQAITTTSKTVMNPKTLRAERKRYYSIGNKMFVDRFMSQLKIVYYLAEDEKNKDNFLDSAMYGHVYQKYLPGMYITLEGKYYEVISMTKNNGVLVRRAADHITKRHYYRTLRSYDLKEHAAKDVVGVKHTYGDITIEHIEADICVNTLGYLEMSEYSDIKNSKRIELSNIEPREYRNKECIKIHLANSTPNIRVTMAALLNELFVTAFPENYQYITASAKCGQSESIQGLMPELNGVEDDCIYIIEDSLIDLGLLINVDRYFVRFLEIICDALNWHQEKLFEETQADDEEMIFAPDSEEPEEQDDESKGIFGFIKRLFRRKKKKNNYSDAGEDEEKSVSKSNSVLIHRNNTMNQRILHKSSEPDDSGITGDDSGSVSVTESDRQNQGGKIPYSKSFFLLYGYDAVPEILNLEAAERYLMDQGFGNNYLKQTRENSKHKKLKWYNYYFEAGTHYCDFCGTPLEGEYDLLDDGRERCSECSKEAITKLKDFKKLYRKTRKEMEKIFGIKLKAKIRIKMCNAQRIAEELGETFTPSANFDGRTLGFAYRNGKTNDIYIENGAPAIETARTLVHEMTHIWQYANLPEIFEGGTDLTVVEGMAVWTEVQYLTSIGLKDRARDYAYSRLMQDNEYGNGLKMYLEKYPIRNKEKVHKNTPFDLSGNLL